MRIYDIKSPLINYHSYINKHYEQPWRVHAFERRKYADNDCKSMWSSTNALEIMRCAKGTFIFFFFWPIVKTQGPLGQRTGSWRSNTGIQNGRRGGSVPDKRIIRIIRSPDDAPRRTYVRISARSAAVPFSRSTGRRHARSSVSLFLSLFFFLPLSRFFCLVLHVTFTFDLQRSTFLTREYVRGFF